MLRKKEWLSGSLAAFMAVAFASAAYAQNPPMTISPVANHNMVGSVVASPYFATSAVAGPPAVNAVFTAILVTNTLASDAQMHIHVINADTGGSWGEQDWFCGITPNETTMLLITDDGTGPRLRVECSEQVGIEVVPGGGVTAGLVDGQPGTILDEPLNGQRGVVVITEVALFNTNTTVTTNNRFIADWTTIDVTAGTAISAEALHFQSVANPMAVGNNQIGDGAIGFGTEVSSFPSVLGADFFAPTPDGEIVTEVLLLTLDGKEGIPPRQRVDGWVYDDDEDKQSFPAREWECIDHFPLTALGVNLRSDNLCANAPLGCVGHIVLNSANVSVDFSPHDDVLSGFGDGNQVRKSAFDGYIIHRFNRFVPVAPAVQQDGRVLPALVAGIANSAATVRILNRGTNTFSPLGSDQVVLDLR